MSFSIVTLIICCHCILLLDWWPAVSFDTGILPRDSSAFSLHIIWFINLAAGFRRVSKCDLYTYCLPFETSFEWCLWNRGSSLMTAFFRFLEGVNVLVLENPYWITWSYHFGLLPTFCRATVCDSFMTVRFLRTGATGFAHRTSHIFEMFIIFLRLHLIFLAHCMIPSLF